MFNIFRRKKTDAAQDASKPRLSAEEIAAAFQPPVGNETVAVDASEQAAATSAPAAVAEPARVEPALVQEAIEPSSTQPDEAFNAVSSLIRNRSSGVPCQSGRQYKVSISI